MSMFFDVFLRVVWPYLIWPFFGFDFFGPIQRDGIWFLSIFRFLAFFHFWPFFIDWIFGLIFYRFLAFFYRSFFWTVLVECGISRATSFFLKKTRKSRKKSKK